MLNSLRYQSNYCQFGRIEDSVRLQTALSKRPLYRQLNIPIPTPVRRLLSLYSCFTVSIATPTLLPVEGRLRACHELDLENQLVGFVPYASIRR